MEKHIRGQCRVSSLGSLSYPIVEFEPKRGHRARKEYRELSKIIFIVSKRKREKVKLFLHKVT